MFIILKQINIIYTTKFVPSAFDTHTNFLAGTLTFSILSSGVKDIFPDTPAAISSATTQTVGSGSYTNQSYTYTFSSPTTSDVYYQTNDQAVSVVENASSSVTPTLTCSSSGSTAITYSLSAYNGGTVPSWVSINSSTGTLTVTASSVSADTEFDFYVDSTIAGVVNPVKKLIKLTVTN